jgi:hypothetical protein
MHTQIIIIIIIHITTIVIITTEAKRTRDMAQVVEQLPSKCQVLNSNHSTHHICTHTHTHTKSSGYLLKKL